MIKDIYPMKAQYHKGETICIKVEFDKPEFKDCRLQLKVLHLQEEVYNYTSSIPSDCEEWVVSFILEENMSRMEGFGVEAEIYEGSNIISKVSTAFDILEDWKYAPRYGFLSDFDGSQIDDEKDVEFLNKHHINVVQFYDWMYRHHELMPPKAEFIDAMGRSLSLDVVKQKIDYTHKYGMRAMAYGAVYGCEKEFLSSEKCSPYYRNDGKVLSFIDFIYMMDINRNSPWHDHIINEFKKAVDFGFNGIHMDQYGFPKEAIAKQGENFAVRHLREDFPSLIEDTRKSFDKEGKEVDLIFNAVNNWPIDTVSKAPQDCMYIEVWSPNDTYEDLNKLIANAKRCSPEKQVILAAYLKPFSEKIEEGTKEAENNALLTMSVIFSSGGFHLLLGENNGVLTEAYYPSYASLSSEVFSKKLRMYYDFIVRYEELIFDLEVVDNTATYTGGINGEYIFNGSEFSVKPESNKIWTQVKEGAGSKIIHMINFKGINNMNWNEGKPSMPEEVRDIEITALVVEKVKGVYYTSPDFNNCESIQLKYDYVEHGQGKAIKFTVPKLNVWDMVYILVEE